MSDDNRKIGIPPDWKVHDDIVFQMADSPPEMWHRSGKLMDVAKRLEPGNEMLKIGVIDTGYTRHKWLNEPQEARNFTSDSSVDARNPHGPHVWGMIAGLMGIGLLPKVRMYIAKGLSDSGSGATTWLNNAIRWMADMGVHFVNGSYGSSQGSQDDIAAAKYFYEVGRRNGGGYLLHFAAGNAGYNGGGSTIGYPAGHGLCSVNGSFDRDGGRSSFSSGGPKLQILGAGGNVISTIPGDRVQAMSGTSMGSPDQCVKSALLAIARQSVGLPPLYGPDEWAAEYRRLFEAKLLKDGGPPGRDNANGWGQFTTEAIVEHIDELTGSGI